MRMFRCNILIFSYFTGTYDADKYDISNSYLELGKVSNLVAELCNEDRMVQKST